MNRITIDRIERIEGRGDVSIAIDGTKVQQVKLIINEGPRLIEKLVAGKTPAEVLNLVPRICAICHISHRYAAIRSLEKSLAIKEAPKDALLRELMHLGEIIESHALHIFMLALPDMTGHTSAIAMMPQYEFEVKIGLDLKQYGNRIMEITSGRPIHGENPVLGGFGKYPEKKELIELKQKAESLLPPAIKAAHFINNLNYPECPETTTLFAALKPANNHFGFAGDTIALSDGTSLDVQEYLKLANEFNVAHSYARHALYNGKSYTVGALARLNLLGERLQGQAAQLFTQYLTPQWKYNPFYLIPSQMIEIIYSLERIPALINEILTLPDSQITKPQVNSGFATGAVEAPRGILFHHYEVASGKITHADIVTPTAQNAEDIERYCMLFAQHLLDKSKIQEIDKTMRMVVRAFDPCISCSVH